MEHDMFILCYCILLPSVIQTKKNWIFPDLVPVPPNVIAIALDPSPPGDPVQNPNPRPVRIKRDQNQGQGRNLKKQSLVLSLTRRKARNQIERVVTSRATRALRGMGTRRRMLMKKRMNREGAWEGIVAKGNQLLQHFLQAIASFHRVFNLYRVEITLWSFQHSTTFLMDSLPD